MVAATLGKRLLGLGAGRAGAGCQSLAGRRARGPKTVARGIDLAVISEAMTGDVQLLLWIAGVHLLGLGCVAVLLIPALKETPSPNRRSEGEGEDGWGRGPKTPPKPPKPPRGGIPLPDAEPARVRLREPGRLADKLPNRQRRPSREPERAPVRTPQQ
jgi:hypothetical protein